MPKLTDSAVRAAAAKDGKRLELSDDTCQGLRLRVSPSGAKSWAFVGRDTAGKVARVTIGRYPDVSLFEARRRADTARRNAQDGAAPALAGDGLTFATLAGQYIARASTAKKSWRHDELLLKRPLEAWATLPAQSIGRVEIMGLLSEIAQTAPVAANRTQAVLRTLFGHAANDGLLNANPLAGARKAGGRERSKDRILSDAEISILWRALGDDATPAAPTIRLALRTILLTAARPGEVAGMALDELELDGREPVWTIPSARSKNGKAHVVPLSALAVDTIRAALKDSRRLMDGESAFVFTSKWGSTSAIARHSLSQATRRLCASPTLAPGLKPFTPHDLRRTAATLARAAGAPRDAVVALLNHTFDDVTGIYDRYAMLAEKRDAVARIEEKIKALANVK